MKTKNKKTKKEINAELREKKILLEIQERLNAKILHASETIMKRSIGISKAIELTNTSIAGVKGREKESFLTIPIFIKSPLIHEDILEIKGLKLNHYYKFRSLINNKILKGRLVFLNPGHIEIQDENNEFIVLNPKNYNFEKIPKKKELVLVGKGA